MASSNCRRYDESSLATVCSLACVTVWAQSPCKSAHVVTPVKFTPSQSAAPTILVPSSVQLTVTRRQQLRANGERLQVPEVRESSKLDAATVAHVAAVTFSWNALSGVVTAAVAHRLTLSHRLFRYLPLLFKVPMAARIHSRRAHGYEYGLVGG